ncbi:MAG: cation diffusion facilitator family transporter [Marinisporobacter sp.]|jgi:cation diffusion facilitator family transporter|nr:cation diffusion facilitator family transporter [Marinisporobacter sp.]
MNENARLLLGKKASWIGIIGNILLTGLKIIIGVIASSTAMIADALHSGSDIIATTIVLHGIKISHRPPDEEHHYGHGKAESIVAKIIAVLLIITGIGIGASAYHSLKSPNLQAPQSIAIWAAGLSIIVKEWMYRYTVKIGKKIESQALIADAWHHRTDAFSSIAALIGITGAVMGYPILDPIAGIVVALMIIKAGFSIYLDAINELMDTAPSEEIIEQLRKISLSVDGVKNVHKIRARKNGNQIYVDLVICVDKYITVEQGHHFATQAKYNILDAIPNIKDVVVHVDPYPLEASDHPQKKDKS